MMTQAAVSDTHGHPSAPSNGPFGVSMGVFGMWLFLASEVMFFTGLLATYLIYRVVNPDVFSHEAGEYLSWRIGGLNTLLLIASSYTMVLAVRACERGAADELKKWLFTTAGLGTLFLIVKIVLEYLPKFQHDHTPAANLFFACYFALTGVHGLHVLGGVIPLVIFGFTAKTLAKGRSLRVEIMGLYWHFVDLVWIYLFPLLYLVD